MNDVPVGRSVASILSGLAVAPLLVLGLVLSPVAARADAVDALRHFVREVKSGQADFTQTVTSPDGAKKKVSSGRFEFSRPNRFRFSYLKPYAQTIVGDGQKVWFHDPDLNQVTVRKLGDALGATPAALLAGQSLEKDFTLAPEPAHDGLEWVLATPRAKDGTLQWMKAGFRGKALVAVEIADSFGQHSLLQFADMTTDMALPANVFHFAVPAGTDVSEQ
jgi:outer membrane lipoprotein carrier protein